MKDSQRYSPDKGHDRLRDSAEELMKRGAAPRTAGGSLGVDALTLLYRRASSPDSAADALKMLHELQTHQVELDLLYEQIQANEREMTEALNHYRALYDHAPAAYLIVTGEGRIVEANQAASKLFGETISALAGKALSSLLDPGQDAIVGKLLSNWGEEEMGMKDTKTLSVDLPGRRRLTVTARYAAVTGSVLIILSEIGAYPDES